MLAGSYLLAVWTPQGQALENAALRGADQVSGQDLVSANVELHAITMVSLAALTLLVATIALVRRRVDLAIAGSGLIVLSQAITQLLKRFILPRPELVDAAGHAHNSFPSGHTTIALTVIFALILVVPYRMRGIMMFFAAPWALSIGAYTITAQWHRFSDTLGAMAVALICACLSSWWLARRGRVVRYRGRTFRGRVILAVLIMGLTALTLAMGGLLWGAGFSRGIDFSAPDEVGDYNAYLGASVLSLGFAGLSILSFWGLWHRREVAPAARSAGADTDSR